MSARVLLKDARPKLASLMVDQELAQAVSASSKLVVQWRCPEHGTVFTRAVDKRTRAGARDPRLCPSTPQRPVPGCPPPARKTGRRTDRSSGLRGRLAEHLPELAALMVDRDLAQVIGVNSSREMQWRCPEHGTVFSRRVSNRTRTTGRDASLCPSTATWPVDGCPDPEPLGETHPFLASLMVDQSLATVLTAGSEREVQWHCPEHGTVFSRQVRLRTQKGARDPELCPSTSRNPVDGCPATASKRPTTRLVDTNPYLASLMVDQELAQTIGASSNQVVQWRCPVHGTVFSRRVLVRTQKNARDPHLCPSVPGTIIPGCPVQPRGRQAGVGSP